jgi:S1-C subfamily serine protease
MTTAVEAKKPALKASTSVRDVVLTEQWKPLQLIEELQKMPNRSKAVVSIQRASKTQSLTFARPPKPSLGISLSELEPERRKKHNLPRNRGILIRRVVKAGAAAKAGLRKDDILLEINGYSVNRRNLGRVLQLVGANSLVPCMIIRGEKTMSLKLTVGTRQRN